MAETERLVNPVQQIDALSKPFPRQLWEWNKALRLVNRSDVEWRQWGTCDGCFFEVHWHPER